MGDLQEMAPETKRAAIVGVIVCVVFESLLVLWVAIYPDPQAPIALLFSPIYSSIFGAGVGLAYFGMTSLDRQHRYIFITLGATLLLCLLVFCVGEFWQWLSQCTSQPAGACLNSPTMMAAVSG